MGSTIRLHSGTKAPNKRYSCNQTSVLRQQIMLQELLLLWQEAHVYVEDKDSSIPALPASVKGTLTYMENHYEKSITVKQLAEQANVSIWQYSQMFRKITGKKPLHYLTELRLNHAKRLLLECKRPLREIARQLFVMGMSGFSSTLYHPQGFQPVETIQRCSTRDTASRKLIRTNCLTTPGTAFLCLSLLPQTQTYAGTHDQQLSLAQSSCCTSRPGILRRSRALELERLP
ncbi:helix-turn-helix domain-containing protein [Paenibacillus sp. TY11]|uniref:helix-turn-helix domain-containing protein n=1 Tax=Paenibacillus sp. TY11 TaxID=3448633 RepID=UPI0040392B70